MPIDRMLRDALFNAIEAYVRKEQLGYGAVGDKLGVPRWQMTRWFSKGTSSYTGWTDPKAHVLRALVLADVDPIAAIALAILQGQHAVPENFDFTRAGACFGFNVGLPAALPSANMGNARHADLVRAAAFDLISAFANTQFFTSLAAASIDEYHAFPVHPFGMVSLADPSDANWPPTIGRPLLDWDYGDVQMQRQLAVADALLSAADRESNELYNQLERLLSVRKRAMAGTSDISLAAIAADIAVTLQFVTLDMAKVFRDAADQHPTLAKSPLHRLASKIFEMATLTAKDSSSVTIDVLTRARAALGAENLDKLINTPEAKVVPLVKLSGGSFTTSGGRQRTMTSVLPKMSSGPIEYGDAYFVSSRAVSAIRRSAQENHSSEDSDDTFLRGWR